MKINTKKFLRNIIICVLAWIVVSNILNYAPGYKRDKFKGITKLVINDKDITENLKEKILVSENGTVYFGINDIKNIFDNNILYNREQKIIITTSNTKVAYIYLENNVIKINGVEKQMQDNAFEYENNIFIPITELKDVYNINMEYKKDNDIVVIDSLNKGLIKATVAEESEIKYKPRLLSKSLGKTTVEEEVVCFYTTSKGWRLIRTESGILGYVKANKLDNEYIVRQDYDNEIKTEEITTSLKDGTILNLYTDNGNSKIVIKTLFSLKENGTIDVNGNINEDKFTVWATISNEGLEKYTNEQINNYESREQLINSIIEYAVKYRLKGININFNSITNSSDFCRFIIELTPRLRDLGLTTNVVLNNSFKEEKIIGVVDYLITNKEQ